MDEVSESCNSSVYDLDSQVFYLSLDSVLRCQISLHMDDADDFVSEETS